MSHSVRWFASLIVAVAVAMPARAQEAGWRLRLEPMYLKPYGQDRHVLTIHEVTAVPDLDRKTPITLDTQSGTAWRGALHHTRGRWTWGLEFFYFDTSLETPSLSRAGGAGGGEVALEVADQRFTSSSPGQVVFYQLLEDNDLAVWTFDLYGERTLAQSDGASLALQLGLRFGDFDNDYRAVVGIENTTGTRLDASSNYRRMTGPLVGFAGTARLGPVSFEGSVGQSVIMGEVEFTHQSRQFTGPFGDSPAFFAEERFGTTEKIAIPITALRIRGMVRLIDRISLGAGVHTASWWDVGVPPGVIPIPGGDQVLDENTLVFFAALGVLEIRF